MSKLIFNSSFHHFFVDLLPFFLGFIKQIQIFKLVHNEPVFFFYFFFFSVDYLPLQSNFEGLGAVSYIFN